MKEVAGGEKVIATPPSSGNRETRGTKLEEEQYKAVKQKFSDLGSSTKVAEELGIEVVEVNRAVKAQGYRAYIFDYARV